MYTSPIQIWSRRNADTLNTIRKVSSASDTGSGAWEPDKLLALALSRPSEALVAAREVLAGHPSAAQAAVAHQAAGVVLKDFGDIDQAIGEFKAARRFARRAGDLDREADVSASLGMTLVLSGQPRRGLSVLDTLLERSHGVLAGRILIRRVGAFYVLGRNAEALHDVQAAVGLLSGAGDLVWEARALHWRAAVYLAMGAYRTGRPGLRPGRDLVRRMRPATGVRVRAAGTRPRRTRPWRPSHRAGPPRPRPGPVRPAGHLRSRPVRQQVHGAARGRPGPRRPGRGHGGGGHDRAGSRLAHQARRTAVLLRRRCRRDRRHRPRARP